MFLLVRSFFFQLKNDAYSRQKRCIFLERKNAEMLMFVMSWRLSGLLKEKLNSLKSVRFRERPKRLEITQSTIFIVVWKVSRNLEINEKLTRKWPKNAHRLSSKESPKAPKYLIYKHLNVFQLSRNVFVSFSEARFSDEQKKLLSTQKRSNQNIYSTWKLF